MTVPISADISTAQKDAARVAIRALLQEQDPTLDISIGGPVDSLLVDGDVLVVARNDANTDRAYLVTQLQAIADGTVTVSDDEVDRLMAAYFLTRLPDDPAFGTVVFVVQLNQPYVFQAGYILRANGQTYQLSETFSVYPPGTTGVDFAIPTNVVIEQAYDQETGYLYRFRLPIVATLPGAASVLVDGNRLSVDQAFVGLGYVQAVTNFQGGTSVETNAEFVSRALQGPLAKTLGGGQNQIDALIQTYVPRADSNSIGTGSPLMTRDRNNVFNIPVGGKIDIYAKSGAIAQRGWIVEAVVTDYTLQQARITLTRDQSGGVYRLSVLPLFITTPPTGITGNIVVDLITHAAWVGPEFNPEMPAEVDRAFSAHQIITIDITDTRQLPSLAYVVPMTSNGQIITNSYEVSTEYQPGIIELDDALMDATVRPPGLDALVKAAVPCIVTLGIQAKKPVQYNGPTAAALAASIALGINEIAVETESLDAYTIAALLQQASPTLVLLNVAMTGLIYGQDGVNVAVAQVGQQLPVPLNLAGKFSGANVYFTTTPQLVTVTLI